MQCFSFRSDAACEKTVIYLPGGAFVRQPSVQHFKFADRLCRATVAEIIICIYPKAPEHTYSIGGSLFAGAAVLPYLQIILL